MKDSGDRPLAAQVTISGSSEIRYLDMGSGNPVLVLQATLENALVDQLSRHFRVIAFDLCGPRDPVDVAKAVAETADRLAVTSYCLIGESELAASAVAPTTSPTVAGDTSQGAAADLRLEEIHAPTLALFGTRDEMGCESGRAYAR